jgi:hypothetical protein
MLAAQMDLQSTCMHVRRAGREANAGNHLGASAESVSRARARVRALKNWRRAKYAVTRKITQDMLGVQRKCARAPPSTAALFGPACKQPCKRSNAGHLRCCWLSCCAQATILGTSVRVLALLQIMGGVRMLRQSSIA